MKKLTHRHVLAVLLPLFALPLLAGCGLFKIREKDEVAVGRIRKVAVVAFSAVEPAASAVSLNLNHHGQAETVAGGSMLTQHSDATDDMFEGLRSALAQNLHWQVMEQAAMITNAGYQTAYDKTMKGWQSKMPPGEGEKQFAVKDLMDFDSGRILGADGRERLIQALGVDSIIVARVNVSLSGTTFGGFGPRYPRSRVSFQVYSRGQAKPVWFDGAIDGEVSHESVGATAFFDEELLGRLAAQSAVTAFNKIGSHL